MITTVNKDALYDSLEKAYQEMWQASFQPQDDVKLAEASALVSMLYKQYFSPPYDTNIKRSFEKLYHFKRWGKTKFLNPNPNHDADMEQITNDVREFYADFVNKPHIRMSEALHYINTHDVNPAFKEKFIFCIQSCDQNELLVVEDIHAYCDYGREVEMSISEPVLHSCLYLPVVSDQQALSERPCMFDFFGIPVWTHPNKSEFYFGRERSENIYFLG